MTRRRGFTLLETVLAIAVGSMVLAAALGVMATIRDSDLSLAAQSEQMNELARTQLAVRSALSMLRVAPDDAISAVISDPEQAEAIRKTPFPDPIPGLAARLEMTTGTNPRLEAVLREPLLDQPRRAIAADADDNVARISAEQLPGHRGAFEVRREEGSDWPTLWWVPLPPRDMPATVVFDVESLPAPRRLCHEVRRLTWTAFIDRQRVPLIRAIEKGQLPAYIELEIETAGGGYGNWMFELGWIAGPEFDALPDDVDSGSNAVTGTGAEDVSDPGDPSVSGNPGRFDPDTNTFAPEDPG